MVDKKSKPKSGNGLWKFSISWHAEDGNELITEFSEEKVLQHLFKKEHLPTAEQRIFEYIDAALNPIKIELVSHVNSLIEAQYESQKDARKEEPLPIGNDDTEETEEKNTG